MLPARAVVVPAEPEPEPVDLDAIWPTDAGGPVAPDDGAVLTVRRQGSTLAVDLVLPDRKDESFRVRSHWGGVCFRYDGRADAWAGEDHVHLRWDGVRIVVDPVPPTSTPPEAPRVLPVALVAAALALVAEDGPTAKIAYRTVHGMAERGRFGSAGVRSAMQTLLTQPEVSPARVIRALDSGPHLLPTLWPLLTEPIRVAGLSDEPPPRWLNQVLVVALAHAPTLRAAAAAGRLPGDVVTWPGLAELAARPGRSATLEKARSLQTLLS